MNTIKLILPNGEPTTYIERAAGMDIDGNLLMWGVGSPIDEDITPPDGYVAATYISSLGILYYWQATQWVQASGGGGNFDPTQSYTFTGSNDFLGQPTSFTINDVRTTDEVAISIANDTPADDTFPVQNSPILEFTAHGSDGSGGQSATFLMHEYLESYIGDEGSRLVWEFSRDGGATFLPPALWLYDAGGMRIPGTFECGTAYIDSGGLHNAATQTPVNGSTSGTVTFSQPEQGGSYKKVIAYCDSLNGTASYTFPVAFTQVPVKIYPTGISAITVSVLTTSSVTLSAAPDGDGFVIFEGY